MSPIYLESEFSAAVSWTSSFTRIDAMEIVVLRGLNLRSNESAAPNKISQALSQNISVFLSKEKVKLKMEK